MHYIKDISFSFNRWFEALVACPCEREVKMMVQFTNTGWWMSYFYDDNVKYLSFRVVL